MEQNLLNKSSSLVVQNISNQDASEHFCKQGQPDIRNYFCRMKQEKLKSYFVCSPIPSHMVSRQKPPRASSVRIKVSNM